MAMMNPKQYDQYKRMPELGQPITKTLGTLDMQDDIDKFRKTFQCEYYAGFQYRKVAPIHIWSSSNMIDMETRDEPGFLIAVTQSRCYGCLRRISNAFCIDAKLQY